MLNSDATEVVSKYFVNVDGMDESLSEFKDKKKSSSGPKKDTLSNVHKNKVKKTRRLKGQKDIRLALDSKKSNLVSYTKDFEKVCKVSGIDVDAEQLQLAIALSLSEQKNCNYNNECEGSTSQSSQERVRNIRSTLLEYGFKVPEVKITSNLNKKVKRFIKDCKLLLTSESQRLQIVTEKYSQIVFEPGNISNKSQSYKNACEIDNRQLYYLTTNISYDLLKSDKLYYVEGLIDQMPNTAGCLLKDWSIIPGRPVSPEVFEIPQMISSDVDCSQNEINIILSGTIKHAQEILKSQNNILRHEPLNENISVTNNQNLNHSISKMDSEIGNIVETYEVESSNQFIKSPKCNEKMLPSNTVQENSKMSVFNLEPYRRSVSPDIFDDDISIIDVTKETASVKPTVTLKDNHDCMDLTDCANITCTIKPIVNVTQPYCQLSQETNHTQRKSNDFMEITNCVPTMLSSECNSDVKSIVKENINIIILDISGKEKDQDTPNIHLNDEIQMNIHTNKIIEDESIVQMDLTQSSNSDDDTLPYVQLSGSKNLATNFKSLDEVVNESEIIAYEDYHHSKNSNEQVSNCSNSLKSTFKSSNFTICMKDVTNDKIDLTQSSNSSIEPQNDIFNADIINIETIDKNNLGKQDNVSIDYDEVYDLERNQTNDFCDLTANLSNKNYKLVEDSSNRSSINVDCDEQDRTINLCNQSEVIEFPNEKINNSVKHIDELAVTNDPQNPINIVESISMYCSILPTVDIIKKDKNHDIASPIKAAPLDDGNIGEIKTPSHTKYIVKTSEVTPMLDYASMSTPDRNKELDKYGLKPFKRKRAIQLLTHIYNQTHPFVEESVNEEESTSKKYKNNKPCISSISPTKKFTVIMDDVLIEHAYQDNIYEVTLEKPDIRDIECNPEDWFFQKREKAKVHSCKLPLHIAFHNYVSCRRGLRESILRYEPVNIDHIHKQLIQSGHRYDPKDLLKFLDKKCITVKTVENNGRNKR